MPGPAGSAPAAVPPGTDRIDPAHRVHRQVREGAVVDPDVDLVGAVGPEPDRTDALPAVALLGRPGVRALVDGPRPASRSSQAVHAPSVPRLRMRSVAVRASSRRPR